MGDYLDTQVERCKIDFDSTEVILSHLVSYGSDGNLREHAKYTLPFALSLERGDSLSFYQGTVRSLVEPVITHEDYQSVDINRRGKLLARFRGEDLHILEHLARKVEPAEIV